ncbi:MAG TPA: hypothetical protein VGH16_17370 [Candidatus Binatia bacterium]|jgi:hypothetical protein
MKRIAAVFASIMFLPLFSAAPARAHGVIGQRFIPSTLAVEDPFASDEMDLLAINRGPRTSEGRETGFGFEISKRLHPDFAVSVEWEYQLVDPSDGPKIAGGANPEFNFKYVAFRSPAHEAIFSAGLSVEPGGIGAKKIAEKVTTISPAIYFGKGFGDLPDALDYLKPLALTGTMELDVPANRKLAGDEDRNATVLGYGFALQYSIPYLQQFVKDVGIGAPFDRMFPLLEFNFETNVNNPERGATTAYVNPGLIWVGHYVELGLGAQIPLNNRSGANAGIRSLVHVFLDDLWPSIFTWTPFGTIGPTQK